MPIKKYGMFDYSLSLGAGETIDLAVNGDYFHVQEATSEIKLSFDESQQITRSQGQGESRNYSRVSVYSAAAQNVIITFGFGTVFDSRATVAVANLNVTIENANLNTPLAEVSIGAGATVLLSAADSNRKELRIGVKSSEANGIYWGDATTGAAIQGGYIEEGSYDYISSEAAIYGYNPGVGAVTVNLVTLRRV